MQMFCAAYMFMTAIFSILSLVNLKNQVFRCILLYDKKQQIIVLSKWH